MCVWGSSRLISEHYLSDRALQLSIDAPLISLACRTQSLKENNASNYTKSEEKPPAAPPPSSQIMFATRLLVSLLKEGSRTIKVLLTHR